MKKVNFYSDKDIFNYGKIIESFVYELGTMFCHTILMWCGIITYPRGHGKYTEIWKVVNESNILIGITGLYSLRKNNNRQLWIGWTAIFKIFRRYGYGKLILKKLERTAKQRGAKSLLVYCESESIAEKFYKSNGYSKYMVVWEFMKKSKTKYRIGDEFDDATDIILIKHL